MGLSATVAVSVSAVTTVLRGSALAVRLLTSDRGGQRLWVGFGRGLDRPLRRRGFLTAATTVAGSEIRLGRSTRKILVLSPEQLERECPIVTL